MTDQGLRLSVIVPARRCASMLRSALEALRASDLPPADWELIVVDDDSRDDTAATAAGYATHTVTLSEGPHGPAHARNEGAKIAKGRHLAFVDADVLVHPDALRGLADRLDAAPGLGAVFGAYDTSPPAPGLVSQYRNLVHHWVHWQSAGELQTFWAGCGAVRASAFREAGGFNAEQFKRPQIEDIELGFRLHDAGWRILLDPTLQGTHQKKWTLLGGLVTDIRDRGVPWAQLLMSQRGARGSSLNLGWTERLATASITAAAVISVASIWDSRWLLASLTLLVLGLIPSVPFLRWLNGLRGPVFTACVLPLRVLYYLAGALSVLVAAWKTIRRGPPGAKTAAINEQRA